MTSSLSKRLEVRRKLLSLRNLDIVTPPLPGWLLPNRHGSTLVNSGGLTGASPTRARVV
jgi:hypothetical protein